MADATMADATMADATMAESERGSRSMMDALRRRAEPLWIAALGIHFVVLGRLLVPAMIHLVGRGGQVETVEWAIYMSLLIGYIPLVLILASVSARPGWSWVISMIRQAIVAGALIELVYYILTANWLFLLTAVIASAMTLAPLGYARARRERGRAGAGWTVVRIAPLVIVGSFSWMCASGIVSWGDSLAWLAASPRTLIALVAATALTIFALPPALEQATGSSGWLRWWDYLALAVLVAFSFRTFPVVELYHWGFYVGPIEQLRQGGRLLWDTPSQYGFLSILIPTVLPGSAWLSFWFHQSVIFAIIAVLMYTGIRRLGTRWTNGLFALVVTFATLFFRPRDQSLILSAQMTPSGGPVRFLWCFVLLAFIADHYFGATEERTARRFVIGGTLIWLASVVWSAEGAIYCSAIWFSAYAVFLVQHALEWRGGGMSAKDIAGRLAVRALMPLAGLAAVVALMMLIYRLFIDVPLDWHGYLEYAVLYSRGGFGALPVDPTGSVWYLLLLFLAISTMAGMYFSLDGRDPRLVVFAGVWGGAWSVGSYFVGRSHPVNALSLVPLLLFSTALGLRLLIMDRSRRWHRLVITALVPAFAMPIALTFGHAGFLPEVMQRQLPLSRFTEQVPAMEPALHSLLVHSGARPSDSYVRVGDGRLMLPGWPTASPTRGRIVSSRSWLPKPYEIIGSLPAERRQTYIDRDARSIPEGGWLIHSKHDTIAGYTALLAQIECTRHEERRYENADWILSWMAIGPRASGACEGRGGF